MNRRSIDRRGVLQLTAAGAAGAVGLSSVTAATSRDEVGPGEKYWSFETEFGITRSSPTVVDDVLYVGGRDGIVYAIDTDDGTEVWSVETEGLIVSSPAVVTGTLYVGSNDGNVYALDTADGSEEWVFETDVDAEFEHVWSSPTVADGTVYVGGKDSNVYAIDADDGTEEWVFSDPDDWVVSAPTVADGTVYIGSGSFFNEAQATVYAIDADDGTEQWSFEAGDYVASSPTVYEGTVYVGDADSRVPDDGEVTTASREPTTTLATTSAMRDPRWLDTNDGTDLRTEPGSRSTSTRTVETLSVEQAGESEPEPVGNVYAIDADDGTEQWSFETDDVVRSSPTAADGSVYIGSRDSRLYSLAADDGTEQWSFEAGNTIESSPTVADGVVFAGSYDGNIYAIDTTDGSEVWTFETDGNIRSSPTVVDGTLYIGADGGHGGEDVNVYAVNAGVDGSSEGSRLNRGTLGNHHEWVERAIEGPEATFTVDPSEPEIDTEATFDAAGSGGDIDDYEWTSPDVESLPKTGETIAHTFEEPGEYDVTLTVTIGSVSDSTTKTVSVVDPDSDDDDSMPGFGIVGTLSGIGGASYLLKRRLEDESARRQ
ncbi:PQQ-binding-like beta-propeller repeat protein [Natronolimnohabitans sp. A-GB9]|uniref:outer membrane protein assembly factor BamB family protein n=1 Tax=Natronolimnohabitans sp. A-GB9 TaxID=3069757 RepID=UPI0027AF996E|nr:PQQ-binding-like beta-propeller repeat protein [Natronolimnohabitans sp. A-GB9]MDQ2048947.1 PQQ-binding-like beta-propeller repeat protein [Natronolimnohabitans sp. A-GB9]